MTWQQVGGEGRRQITPRGGALTFDQYDKEKEIEIKVLKDDVPELAMNITLELKVVSGKFVGVNCVNYVSNNLDKLSFSNLNEHESIILT